MNSIVHRLLDCVVGILDLSVDRDRVVFHRSLRTARHRLGDPSFDFMSSVPSGVRVEALTDASHIELDVALTRQLLPGRTSDGSTFDLVVDGSLCAPVTVTNEAYALVDPATSEVELQPGGPATVRFQIGEEPVERRVEIWFPASASLTLLNARLPEGTSLRPAPASGPPWLHYGSSISQCSAADRPTGTWPAIVARAAGRSLFNLALGGQCHLDQFTARAIRDTSAAGISLEVGINIAGRDTMRDRAFVPAFHGFLDTVRDGHPDTPIVVISPIVCPALEHEPGPLFYAPDLIHQAVPRADDLRRGALTLTGIRELLAEHVTLRRAEGDAQLYLVDGLDLFGPDDVADLPDGLHPNAAGYRRMAERFLPIAFGEGGLLR